MARREKLKSDRLDARLAKLARQDKEDQATQDIINKQGQRAREVDIEKEMAGQTSVIKPFRALNESAGEEDDKSPALKKAKPQGKSEDDTENPGVARQEEDTRDGAVSEESIELEFGSEIEQDDVKAYEYSKDDDEQEEPSEDHQKGRSSTKIHQKTRGEINAEGKRSK